jgi:uncharacterized membrane protein YeaQ/YmgE (transglycosylase-associated protein family)
MGIVIWLGIGAATGWIASLFLRISRLPDMVVGIVGAVVGGWIVAPLLGGAIVPPADWSPGSILAAVAGAVILLAIIRLFPHTPVRPANGVGSQRHVPKESV